MIDMNTLELNSKPLNNYSTYGDLTSDQHPAVVEGAAQTSSIGFGATVQPQECYGETVAFTWGNVTCVQFAATTDGFAVHNGVGYGEVVAPLPSVHGQATTNNYGSVATTQPMATVTGTAWSVSTATGATVHPIAVCRGETLSRASYGALGFGRDSISSGNLTAPPAFTILQFTRE